MHLRSEKCVSSERLLSCWPPFLCRISLEPNPPHPRSNSRPSRNLRRSIKRPRRRTSSPSAPAPAPASNPSSSPPSSSSQEPSLSDLGFFAANPGNPKLQAELNKRTEMLKIHQRLGLITLAPMAAALITGPMAKAKAAMGKPSPSPPTPTSTFTPRWAAPPRALYSPLLTLLLPRRKFPVIPSTAQFAFMRRWPSCTVPA